MAATDDDLGLAAADRTVRLVGTLVVLAGLGLALLRFAGGTPPEQGLEGAVGALALGAVVAAPGARSLALSAAAVAAGPVLAPARRASGERKASSFPF